jgi:serine protease Do
LEFRAAQVVAVHQRLDLALLLIETKASKASAVPVLRRKGLRQGEEAVALGNPLGLEFFTSSGIISSRSGTGGMIWTTCPVSKGSSGGPLFVRRRGLLVGINTLKLGDTGLGAENLNASIPVEEMVLSLQGPQPECWTWNEIHKPVAVSLARLIPLEN